MNLYQSAPHPYAFFLANGWGSTNLKVQNHAVKDLVGIIEELSFTTIRQQLVSTLIKLAQEYGIETGRGLEFQLLSTHQELANQLGTVSELISRNLMRLQAEELLKVDARRIVMLNMQGLSTLLEVAN